MSLSSPSPPFRLRDRQVDPARNSISGPEGDTGIEPKVMAVLCVLAGEPGRVFARGELIDLVWGTEYGADESLTRAISLLRKALGDTRGQPAVIETISKRGYRLLPQALMPAAAPLAPAAGKPPLLIGGGFILAALVAYLLPALSGEASGPIAVTVLPFNAVQKQAYPQAQASAITMDLVSALAQQKRLHVTTSRPDPAAPSGARFSIAADLQILDGRVKSDVAVMDADSGRALWSRRYERGFDGSLADQDRLSWTIARDLVDALPGIARDNRR